MNRRLTGLVCALLCCALLPLAAFAEEAAEEPAAPTLLERVRSVAEDGADLIRMTADDLLDLMGIEEEDVADFAYLADRNALSGRELIVIVAADEEAADRVEEMLNNYLTSRLKETRNYLPEAYRQLSAAEVRRSGLTLVLAVGDRAQEETEQLLTEE